VTSLQSCTDQTNSLQTTMSQFPAEPTFSSSPEFCILMVKFVDKCKDQYKAASLNDIYPPICEEIPKLKGKMKEVLTS
jgi:hypothetical protein